MGERTPISAAYQPGTREFILAAIKIAIVVLDEQLNPQHTDGFTHSRAVAKVLYNPLFKVIITCGMDSIIINWNPVTGEFKKNKVEQNEDCLFKVDPIIVCNIVNSVFGLLTFVVKPFRQITKRRS